MTTTKGNKKVDAPAPAVPADSIQDAPRDQIAASAQNGAYDTLPVTVGNLKQNLPAMLAPILQAMSEQFEDRLKQERDATTKQINEANAGMMDTIKGYLEQLNTSINQAQQGGGGGAAQPQDQKGQFLQMLQPSIERALNKALGFEEHAPMPENDRLLQLLKTGAERELKNTLLLGIKKNVRKGLLYQDEVEAVLGESVEALGLPTPPGAHGPLE